MMTPEPIGGSKQDFSTSAGEMGYNFEGEKGVKNGRKEALEGENLYDRVKNFSNDKGVRDLG
jgi:hypothetical protein